MIILLSGTSCSGKTSVTRALQKHLPEPYLHIGLDYFEAMQPARDGKRIHILYGQRTFSEDYADRGPDLIPVVHQCIRAFADAGANAVVEHIFFKRRWLKDAVEKLSDAEVMFVGVQCALPTLAQRERERRGNNADLGQAEEHFQRLAPLNQLDPYDFTIDTSTMTPDECALAIRARLEEGSPFDALQRLRGSHFLDEADPA